MSSRSLSATSSPSKKRPGRLTLTPYAVEGSTPSAATIIKKATYYDETKEQPKLCANAPVFTGLPMGSKPQYDG